MNTRKQYLNNECTHREYYGQFVTNMEKAQVKRVVGIDKLINSTDEHLNDIPLKTWDNMACHVGIGDELKECGDYFTLSCIVCVNKEAARQLIEEHTA